MRTARRLLSPLGVLLAFAAGWWGLTWLTDGSWDAVAAGNPTFEALLVFVVSVLAWVCYCWLALSFLLVGLSAVPGAVGSVCGALADRLTPRFARRAARFALGISVVAAPVLGMMPANAATDISPQTTVSQQLPSLDRPVSGTTVEAPNASKPTVADTNLPTPDRPVSGQAMSNLPNTDRPTSGDAVTRAPTRHQADEERTHVVVRGDTLWDIAKANLPADANDAEISTEWHRWYDANRQVIGDDPDLILPGQQLVNPDDGR